ncbi:MULTISPECIES: thioredoxin family protein [unclassified Bradyrhizobium]|uniref:thioredoxin family protein n=1 Tax=unclassified Bradyrhizobium TaxID=2631580 RepID=UPI002916A64B|nr:MULTISPECIES: thioredoxin family protein [unclassified Bradyrhizobium]
MKSITDSTALAEIHGAIRPIVIKFEARWCQPCKAMKPMLDDIEKQLDGKVDFYVADVEQCMNAAQLYRVNQIPALVAIDKGVVIANRVGAGSKAEIFQWIRTAIPGAKE